MCWVLSQRLPLLLGSSSLLVLLLLAGGSCTLVSVVGSSLSQHSEGLHLLLLAGDRSGLLDTQASRNGEGGGSVARRLGALQVWLLSLVLLAACGDDNDSALVCLDALDVEGQALLASVLPSVVNWDSNRSCLLGTDTSCLDFLKGEASSFTQLGVVLECRASDGRSERLQRSGSERGSLCLSCIASALLSTGLVEPNLDSSLPILSKEGEDVSSVSYTLL